MMIESQMCGSSSMNFAELILCQACESHSVYRLASLPPKCNACVLQASGERYMKCPNLMVIYPRCIVPSTQIIVGNLRVVLITPVRA